MLSMVIGVDHGYGRMKTAHCNFVDGVTASNHEFPFQDNVLKYKGKWYSIGGSRLPYMPDKTQTEDYYILTLAACAQEMKARGATTASVNLAAGTPLTRYGAEKDKFTKYLMKNKEIAFEWEGEPFHIKLIDTQVYAQGLSALVYWQSIMKQKVEDVIILADLGSGTLDVALLQNMRIRIEKSYSLNEGINNAYIHICEKIRRVAGQSIDESIIDGVLLDKNLRIKKEYRLLIEEGLCEYAAHIYSCLRDLNYNLDTAPVYWIGGGAQLMKKYGNLDDEMNVYILNPCANALGYELTYKSMQAKAKAAVKTTKK